MVLLRALESVPDAPLLVVVGGTGWRCRETVRRIQALEAAGRVRHLGWVEDSSLAALYSGATLMVYPSFYEGFGLPVLEAMACGCPVLCSWSSSLPEVGGDVARYFRPRDGGDLARRIRELIDDAAVLAEMSAKGRRRAQGFSYRTSAEQMLRLMRGAMEQTRDHR
jgi:alpha-1,3-rhamnosyl/mannosyltransferase